jgi:SAM-dependent methyltransferase
MHQFVLNKSGLNSNDITADISSSGNEFNKIIASKVKNHYRLIAKGIEAKHETEEYRIAEIDYNSNFSENFKKISFTKCYVLDIFEHIEKPENFLKEIFKIMKPESKLFVSSGNIGYLPMRISLLLGQFNYGKKGILDMTHKRLYNISSMKKILEFHGFRVDRIIGFAPPLSDMVNPKLKIFEHIHNYFSKSWPGLFAYNFIIQATRIDDIDEIFEKTF